MNPDDAKREHYGLLKAQDGRQLTVAASLALKDDAFWRHLELLFSWKRKHMAVLDVPQGNEVLIWLLKNVEYARPLKDLYHGSRFSEPTIRSMLKTLVDGGFVVIDRDPEDLRSRTVKVTAKFTATVTEYLNLLRDFAPREESGHGPESGPFDLLLP